MSAAVPAVQDAALLDSYVLEVTALVALLQQMQTSIKKFDTAIAETSRQHPCWAIAQSLPGAGPVMAPRLLAAMGNGKRYQNAHEMQCATGLGVQMPTDPFHCWKDGAVYDESKYIASLKKRNSPLSA